MKRTARILSVLALFGVAAPVAAVTVAHAQETMSIEAAGGMKLKMIDENGGTHCHESGGTCHT